jgi:hypothetical protein
MKPKENNIEKAAAAPEVIDTANSAGPNQKMALNKERKRYLVLVIPRNANALEQGVMSELGRAHVSPQEMNEIAEPGWNELDAMEWFSLSDVEVCQTMVMVSLKSVTEESYKKFSRVVIPGEFFYEGFQGEEMPPLGLLKTMFPYYFACVQYKRNMSPSAIGVRY